MLVSKTKKIKIMEIEINDLRIGDEILVLGQVPKLLTILENPSEKGFYKYNQLKCNTIHFVVETMYKIVKT
jgi:hypothetical protein